MSSSELDTLEYSVKFPTNYITGPDDTGSKVPVVVLLGWAGCKDKYLAKYSQIYEAQGLITLRYITPNKYLFWRHREMSVIGERLVQLLAELTLDQHPIVMHVFSNGGSCCYQHFSRALENSKPPTPLAIKGTIFDSTPGCRRIIPLFKAVSAMFGGNGRHWLFTHSISLLITVYVTVWWVCEWAWARCGIFTWLSKNNSQAAAQQDSGTSSDIIQYLKTERNRWPQHCIYSKADDLIPYHDIESFMAARRAVGVDVTGVRFEDSPHVKHYIEHRDAYVQSVHQFLSKCLGNQHMFTNSLDNHKEDAALLS